MSTGGPEEEERLEPRPIQHNRLEDEYIGNNKYTDNYYEYEEGEKLMLVKGRLRKNISFWESINTNSYILDVIHNGYKIPFYTLPERNHSENNKSALKEKLFVNEAIIDLINRGLVVKCNTAPTVVNPLTVAVQNSGKKRLILDLREVNQNLWKQSVKFEDFKVAMLYLKPNDWMFKFDIHSAYHFIDIYLPHTEFLGFSWEFEGQRQYFKFLVLPFGLSSAPYVFTKLTRPLIRKWRLEGKCVLMYLDDGFGRESSFEKTESMANMIKQDLLASGFVPKVEKSCWVPVRVLEFLGNGIDTINNQIYIPSRRIDKVISLIHDIQDCVERKYSIGTRKIASMVGQIISMSFVLGHLSQIMTRSLSVDIDRAFSWNSFITLSDESLKQLHYWSENLKNVKHKVIDKIQVYSKIVYSDASSVGFGVCEVSTINGIVQGNWNCDEISRSSTWREIVAVYRGLDTMKYTLSNSSVKWFSDNQGVCSIVTKGSMNIELQEIAVAIFELCIKYSINLKIEWIPRTLNEQADYISKIVDIDDWGIGPDILKTIIDRWGELNIDWFASEHNAKLEIFYSKFWSRGSSGVDAMSHDWSKSFGLFVPPPAMLAKVVNKMKYESVVGVVIFPVWESAIFWPLICNGHAGFVRNVIDFVNLPTTKEYYRSCKNGKGLFGVTDLKFEMIAAYFDFKNVRT